MDNGRADLVAQSWTAGDVVSVRPVSGGDIAIFPAAAQARFRTAPSGALQSAVLFSSVDPGFANAGIAGGLAAPLSLFDGVLTTSLDITVICACTASTTSLSRSSIVPVVEPVPPIPVPAGAVPLMSGPGAGAVFTLRRRARR